LFGKHVITPLFGVPRAGQAASARRSRKGHRHRDDLHVRRLTDVIWWRELSLPVRAIIQANGTLKPIAWGSAGFPSTDAAAAQARYDTMANLTAAKARARTVELLKETGALVGDPRPITHHVKFYEKGDRPLEIVTSRQWFFKTMDHRSALIERAARCAGTRRTCRRATRTG
jgi:valyl-tRNA synthetase